MIVNSEEAIFLSQFIKTAITSSLLMGILAFCQFQSPNLYAILAFFKFIFSKISSFLKNT
nr:MAG TPA: hypothetical protein [Caudoviricetes sp.]